MKLLLVAIVADQGGHQFFEVSSMCCLRSLGAVERPLDERSLVLAVFTNLVTVRPELSSGSRRAEGWSTVLPRRRSWLLQSRRFEPHPFRW